MSPGGPLSPPNADDAGAAVGGVPPSPAPPVPDRGSQAQGWLDDAVSSIRRVGMRYPEVLPEVRDIMNAITRMRPKILSSAPAAEPMSPPV